MRTQAELKRQLRSIDHKGYKAYKVLEGEYDFGAYRLSIDHVQGDPFATPSRVRILYGNRNNIPPQYFETRPRRIAVEDYLLRRLHRFLRNEKSENSENGRGADRPGHFETLRVGQGRGNAPSQSSAAGHPGHFETLRVGQGSGKSGLVTACRVGQEILERTAMRITSDVIEARIEVGFPAYGRTIAAGELETILFDFLPAVAEKTFHMPKAGSSRASGADGSVQKSQMERELEAVVALADDQQYIRVSLDELGLVAFVADGAILPRESGVSQKPMKFAAASVPSSQATRQSGVGTAVAFQSPASLAVTLKLPHRGKVRGMGIKKGITVITGGGFHGKSTLLKALERGVYNHISGDGRELVITDASAFKLRAEEGRCIHETDISMFINNLPTRADTTRFSTENASGSTSQAANTVEALSAGSRVLLIDEDTSATNFMVRDERMARLVSDEKEPITPFIRKIRGIYDCLGVSTILVVGSSGDYLEVADTVLQMDCYVTRDVTARAKELCGSDAPEQKKAASAKACGTAEKIMSDVIESTDETNIAGNAGEAAADETAEAVEEAAAGKAAREAATELTRKAVREAATELTRKAVREAATELTGKAAAEAAIESAPEGIARSTDWLKKRVRSQRIEKPRTHGWDTLSLDKTEIDLRYLEQIVDESQTAAIAYLMQYILSRLADGKKTVPQLAEEAARKIEKDGILSVTPQYYPAGPAAEVRQQEILACLARYRRL
ncbi:MAG: ABC-ATPase domain-containing protein [Lachnospiraceae bacterium]|nr:ABC-ATPase domain-containing protein [Lachnospiraceae bacterium]